MSADRLRSELPPVLTAVVGMVVAVVSGVFGISAHGLAAPLDMGPVTAGQVLMVGAASAGVGAVTAAVARHRRPLVASAFGLICGQGVVHLVMSAGHSHAPPGAASVSPHSFGHHTADPAALQSAMDTAASDPLASAALMSPVMLAAHVAAIGAALLVIAVLAGALAWLSARTFRPPSAVHLACAVVILVAPRQVDARGKQYLISRGGTRAPPVAV